jgi:predicted site-specific integrase-resolvase
VPNLAGMTDPAGQTDSPFMTLREVCDLLHIGKTTLASWRDKGIVEAHPLPSGGWRYPAAQPVIRDALAALRRRSA